MVLQPAEGSIMQRAAGRRWGSWIALVAWGLLLEVMLLMPGADGWMRTLAVPSTILTLRRGAAVSPLDTDALRHSKTMNDKEWMFFDVAKVNVKGGDGGDGCMAMRREYCIEHGGPSGGNGGNGGNVLLECDARLNTLSILRRQIHIRGGDGTNGKGDSRHGTKGADVTVFVPPGTIIRDCDGALAGELHNHGDRMLVARGGRGGRGNEHFKTPRNNAPTFAERGEHGAERWINVELKLVADVGLVGVPNAGKSTLLAAISNAKPKIADYPFTTVVPNLGVCDILPHDVQTCQSLVVADIPGLLEGAHAGKGLGLAFLRHIQRCRVLLHMIRADSIDPVGDFVAINQELQLFNPRLANKTQVVVVNKIDIPEARQRVPQLLEALREAAGHTRIVAISAATMEGVRELMQRVGKLAQRLPRQTLSELLDEDDEAGKNAFARVNFEAMDDAAFQVLPTGEHEFRIVGQKLETIVEMTNWDYHESTLRFQRIMDAEGVNDALEKAGAVQGDTVAIGDFEFDYWDRRNRWVADLGLGDLPIGDH